MAYSMGHQAKAAFGTTSTVSLPIEFISESIKAMGEHLEPDGIRGTRSRRSERVADGLIRVGGGLTCEPGPVELGYLLHRALGGTPSGTNYPLAETVPEFWFSVDRIAKVFVYAGCKVNRLTLRSSQGGLLAAELDILGKTETVNNAGTFPSLTLSLLQPFTHHQAVVTLAGSSREVNNVVVTIDNALIADRFNNSQTRTEIPEGDRFITFECLCPYTASEVALYAQAIAGASAEVVWTNGTVSLGIEFNALQIPKEAPTVDRRSGEILLPLRGVARAVSSNPEITVTLDSTP